jgi:hypothetical protein
MSPAIPGLWKTMQQHERRALSRFDIVYFNSINVNGVVVNRCHTSDGSV